jgi:hypothetical protein
MESEFLTTNHTNLESVAFTTDKCVGQEQRIRGLCPLSYREVHLWFSDKNP